jgi:uncharacterized protein
MLQFSVRDSDERGGAKAPDKGGTVSTLQDIIARLRLEPHPEGGHYRETFRDATEYSDRSVGTAIYYLLGEGEISHWHRVDVAEIWHFYGGAPLELRICEKKGEPVTSEILGMELKKGQLPQSVVPAFHWQSARSLGSWTLVGCTVAPGFDFRGFEMAAAGWAP